MAAPPGRDRRSRGRRARARRGAARGPPGCAPRCAGPRSCRPAGRPGAPVALRASHAAAALGGRPVGRRRPREGGGDGGGEAGREQRRGAPPHEALRAGRAIVNWPPLTRARATRLEVAGAVGGAAPDAPGAGHQGPLGEAQAPVRTGRGGGQEQALRAGARRGEAPRAGAEAALRADPQGQGHVDGPDVGAVGAGGAGDRPEARVAAADPGRRDAAAGRDRVGVGRDRRGRRGRQAADRRVGVVRADVARRAADVAGARRDDRLRAVALGDEGHRAGRRRPSRSDWP